MTAFLTSLAIVFLAEMGDKTQLLAMAFAAKFRWQTVMLGVLVATVANHFFAVYVGNYLTSIIPLHVIKVVASASFILFGLWTIRGGRLTDEDKRVNLSPFWTVAIAFFFAEMGDKTQLATVALAVQFDTMVPVWAGTTTGMFVADGIGIILGIVLHKRIPEKQIKWFAALVFIAFGLWGVYTALAS
jgi:Ca2+/H+ antiporter, TMEM165/GDT1 family